MIIHYNQLYHYTHNFLSWPFDMAITKTSPYYLLTAVLLLYVGKSASEVKTKQTGSIKQ